MTKFEMIKYHGQKYPVNVPLRIEEIAAHFDVTKVESNLGISLHTEYSYGKRKFDSEFVNRFPEIAVAQKESVPQLWKTEAWALQFAEYIVALVGEKVQLKVIEIHPPFNDYSDMIIFIKNYAVFENEIKKYFPTVDILIENRCGSVYKGGKFILSKTEDLFEIVKLIEKDNLNLRIAYDVPQIYTAHNIKNKEQYISLLEDVKEIRNYIGGVHLWGKRLSNSGRKVSHCGDLNSYFGDEALKNEFLQAFTKCFDDEIVRKMVLEVNSGNDDLISIVNDLQKTGLIFV